MLTVPDYSVSMVLDGPVFFLLRVYEPAFDPSAFLGVVFMAAGRGGGPRRELHFHRWGPDPDTCTGPLSSLPKHARRISVGEMGLSNALVNCLESEGITTAAELCLRTAEELSEIRNLTTELLQELRVRLAAAGLWLCDEDPPLTANAEPVAAPDPAT